MTQTTRVIISDEPSPNSPYNHHHHQHGVGPHNLKSSKIPGSWYHNPERLRPSLSNSRSSTSGDSSQRSASSSVPLPPCTSAPPRRARTNTAGGAFDYGFRATPSQCHHHHHRHHNQYQYQQYHKQESSQQPWEGMAQSYTWVLESEIEEMTRKNEETVRWVLEQQERDVHEKTFWVENKYRRLLEEIIEDFQREKEYLKAREEETRRKAWRWQRDFERSVQDEMRRMQAKRREAERYRMAYDRRRAYEDARERERRRAEREREKAERVERERKAWRLYEERWAVLATHTDASDPLTFRTIPWPMFVKPKVVEDVSASRVSTFLLSPLHSEDQTRKERIKSALRRWHPDRFGRLLSRVVDEDKQAVEKTVGTIVRCLNNLLEQEA